MTSLRSPLTVAVAGLGAMGSHVALELSRRGHRVLGFDRFRPPHVQGSSHGKTRIIREAYFEHPQYVPLVQRAYQRWHELERLSSISLYRSTGGLMIGRPDGTLVAGARRSAEEHGLPFEIFSPDEVRSRFPPLNPGADEVGLFEPRAGVLFPERAIELVLELAGNAGAVLHYEEPVEGWTGGTALRIRTARQDLTVDRLILTAGPWMTSSLPGIALPLTLTRQPLCWFAVPPLLRGAASRLPVFIWEWEPGRMWYGFPDLGDGLKAAIHHEGEPLLPDLPRRPVGPEETEQLRRILAARLPGLGPVRETAVCVYTNTASGDFLIDRHPEDPRVLLASPCSGHGFKFAPVIGEVLADLVEERAPRFDLSPFRLDRLLGTPGAS